MTTENKGAAFGPPPTPADDALDRLAIAIRHALGYHHKTYAGLVDNSDVATVRGELQRLREERDALIRDRERWRLEWQAEVKAAEAEVRRLTNKLNEDSQNFEIECLKAERDRLEYRAEAAEAKISDLKSDLRHNIEERKAAEAELLHGECRGWGEVSGDRLAEIETWARDTLSVATISRSRDVLALVEIAKAAREASFMLFDGDEDEARAAERLRYALARLDSGATEGDA